MAKLFVIQLICTIWAFCNCDNFVEGPNGIIMGDDGVARQLDPSQPKVFVSVLVRNKAHILPYFLYYLGQLNYPSERLYLWFRSDHNKDRSSTILDEWKTKYARQYLEVNITRDDAHPAFDDEKSDCDISMKRMTHVIEKKQEALRLARELNIPFAFVLDADVLLVNPDSLQILINQRRPVIAPMLDNTTPKDESLYSNFWGAMNANTHYYERSEDYVDIKKREKTGVFSVPYVNSAVLIDLQKQSNVQGDVQLIDYYPPPPGYWGPRDDAIIMARRNQFYTFNTYVINTEFFGYVTNPQDGEATLERDELDFTYFLTEAAVYGPNISRLPRLEAEKKKEKHTLGFDQVYLINLARRDDRRTKMEQLFELLGISYKYIEAVDGKKIDEDWLKERDIKQMSGYLDPYHKRPLKMGEFGCFLSHYYFWKDMQENGYQSALVFEDDVRFAKDFVNRVADFFQQLNTAYPNWDLFYLGRKILDTDEEVMENTWNIVRPRYSYWTLSYALSARGVNKLLDQQPLSKVVAVDEYLPIMCDSHTNEDWKSQFEPRDLDCYSAAPLLCEPTHYPGQDGYITDTEDSIQKPPDVREFEEEAVMEQTTFEWLGLTSHDWPTVLISVHVRDKQTVLPYLLHTLEQLDYPRDKLYLWLAAEQSGDATNQLVAAYKRSDRLKQFYKDAEIHNNVKPTYEDSAPFEPGTERLQYNRQVRQMAFRTAHKMRISYVLIVEPSALITDPGTLQRLVTQNKSVIAPLLENSQQMAFSNFWGAQDENTLYYKRSEDYFVINNRQKQGLFPVPYVSSCVLLRMKDLPYNENKEDRSFEFLTPPTDYAGPEDEFILYSYLFKQAQLQPYLLNTGSFGFLLHPQPSDASLQDEKRDTAEFISKHTDVLKISPLLMSLHSEL